MAFYFDADYNTGTWGVSNAYAPSRSPTPPPESPSEQYLSTSLQSPPYPPPADQRKLLIFDLNGTLLLRSPRNYQVRKIYLRPYVPALVAYLSHPKTRAWLDVMVWSSAQAHNVREMVERVFGNGEGAGKGPLLEAVWARDTLGLSKNAYHQKTQTTKNLEKPWGFFAPPVVPKSIINRVEDRERYSPSVDVYSLHRDSPAPSSSPTIPPSSLPIPDTDPDPERYPHSAETTLLVDDSPLKARLQPWNHLCVPEYDASARERDLANAGLPPDCDGEEQETAQGPPQDVPVSKDRWRKRRKEGTEDEETPVASTSSAASGEQSEPTFKAPQGMSKRAKRRMRKRLRDQNAGTEGSPSSSPDRLTPAVEEQSTSSPPTESSSPIPGLDNVLPENDASTPPPLADMNGKKRKRSMDSELEPPQEYIPTPVPVTDDPEPFDPTILAVIGVLDHVRTIGNVAAWLRHGGLASILPKEEEEEEKNNGVGVEGESGENSTADPAQWFESRRLLEAWAGRGRKALAKLEIDAIPGIE
ncbi:FCP1-like proteiny domain-containing protein [Mycena kentingensis (nom. inval.)]|nr:FCP1-like proteiny domain-containing protein [Mycena kentingensis (nom. inval.)]